MDGPVVLYDPHRATTSDHKSVSFFELLFDLIYVVSLASLSHLLEGGLHRAAHSDSAGTDLPHGVHSGGGHADDDGGEPFVPNPFHLDDFSADVMAFGLYSFTLFFIWLSLTGFHSRFNGGNDALGRLIQFGLLVGTGAGATCIPQSLAPPPFAALPTRSSASRSLRACCTFARSWRKRRYGPSTAPGLWRRTLYASSAG